MLFMSIFQNLKIIPKQVMIYQKGSAHTVWKLRIAVVKEVLCGQEHLTRF
jgi:hypothetical protein